MAEKAIRSYVDDLKKEFREDFTNGIINPTESTFWIGRFWDRYNQANEDGNADLVMDWILKDFAYLGIDTLQHCLNSLDGEAYSEFTPAMIMLGYNELEEMKSNSFDIYKSTRSTNYEPSLNRQLKSHKEHQLRLASGDAASKDQWRVPVISGVTNFLGLGDVFIGASGGDAEAPQGSA